MSIYAYVGLPGSGKSYGVVANQVIPALKKGRKVVTNLPLKVELLQAAIPGCEVELFETSQLAEQPDIIDELFPPGCVAIIDECWRLWPSGLKTDKVPAAYKSFLAEHRHRVDEEKRSTQIVLVTQDLQQLAAFARQLVEQTFLHRKLGSLGMDGSFTVSVYEGCVTGTTPSQQRLIIQSQGRYKKEVFQFYKSHTMSKATEGGADERAMDSRGNVWKRPMVWLGMAASLAGLAFGGQWVYGAVKKPESAVGAAAVGGEPTQPQSAFPQVPKIGGRPQAVPAVWRVSGYIEDSSDITGGVAFITNGTQRHVVPLTQCRRSRWIVACDFNGLTIDMAGSASKLAEPIGPYDSASAAP